VGGRIIVQQEKISRPEPSWTNPLDALQQAIHYSFIYRFSLWYEFFVHDDLRVETIINMVFMRDVWNFSASGRGDVSPTHSELSLCFGVIGKTPGLIFRNNFVKKCLSASAITIMSRQDVTRSSFAQVSRSVAQNVHTTCSFPNPLSESKELQSWGCSNIMLSFLMRLDGHF